MALCQQRRKIRVSGCKGKTKFVMYGLFTKFGLLCKIPTHHTLPHKPHLIQFNTTGEPAVGFISSTQFAGHLPFTIKRVFWTYETPQGIVRGKHAHKQTEQVLVTLNGTVKVTLDNGRGDNESFYLDNPAVGLYLPPMYWANIHLSEGAILLSMTSADFEEKDYIRNYELFLHLANQSADR